jgi:hypothetical protein
MSLPISLPTEAMRTREFLDCLSDLVMREAQDILHLSKTTIYRMRIDAGLEKTWPYRSICKNHHPTLTWASITRTRDRLINTSSDVLVRLVLVRVKSAALANRIFNDKDFLTTQPNNTSLIHKTFFEFYKHNNNKDSLNYQSVLMKPDGASSVATFASAVLCFNPQPETDEQYNQRLANALLGDDAPATLVAPDTTLTTATDYEWITTTGTTPSMFEYFYTHPDIDDDWVFTEPEPATANYTTEPSP